MLIVSFCMQSIKEHNLKANHNEVMRKRFLIFSVCNLSKNTIWKQITTKRLQAVNILCLYAIYQRTQSESKSQRCSGFAAPLASVCNLSKNTIWKQITTPFSSIIFQFFLYAIYQRTQSESKSQQIDKGDIRHQVCMQSIKEHNLKANHNGTTSGSCCTGLYAIYQRTQSESKSQPTCR